MAKVKGTQKSGTDHDEKSWQKVKILIMKKLPLILKKRPHETIKITAEIKKERLDIISQPDPKNHIDLKSEPGD